MAAEKRSEIVLTNNRQCNSVIHQSCEDLTLTRVSSTRLRLQRQTFCKMPPTSVEDTFDAHNSLKTAVFASVVLANVLHMFHGLLQQSSRLSNNVHRLAVVYV